jgi:TRAP-type C4-dicarboxylate transport system permease small subunit
VKQERPAAKAWEDRGVFGAALRWLGALEDTLLVLLLSGMVVLSVWQIVLRNFSDTAIVWGDPLLRVLVLWVGFLGAVAASRDDRQISVDVISRFAGEPWRSRIRVVTDVFTSAVSGFLAWHAFRFVKDSYVYEETAFASVPLWLAASILPTAFVLLSLRYLLLAIFHVRRGAGGTVET